MQLRTKYIGWISDILPNILYTHRDMIRVFRFFQVEGGGQRWSNSDPNIHGIPVPIHKRIKEKEGNIGARKIGVIKKKLSENKVCNILST